jgi:hypothetical protein
VPLRIIYHYKLANAVPLDGDASYAEIAATSGLSETLCLRFIRCAMSNNIFDEDPKTGRIRHTAVSRLLATNQGLCDAVGLELEDIAPATSKLPDAWEKYGQDASEPNETAFNIYNDTSKPLFGVFGDYPKRGRRFGSAMQLFTLGDGWGLQHVLTAFDWASLDKPGAAVIDVGGGFGTVSQYLAHHTSNIHFVVQDLPHVVSMAPAKLPEDLKDRIDFVVHDFHKPQPSEPAPVAFLLRWVLHNWSDKYCINILKNLNPALRTNSKVLIYEYVLEGGPVTDLTGRVGFVSDMIMMTLFNGQERTTRDFERVLKTADERFVFEGVRRPKESTMSVVEVGWRD